MSGCPPYSLGKFPVGMSLMPTIDMYTSVLDPLKFQFQWGVRTTAPRFMSGENGIVDEFATTTLRYDGKTYVLESVQITDPTHKSWIVPATTRQNNLEDIILRFAYIPNINQPQEYIVIVIPILRSTISVKDPPYLTAFGTTSPSQISLQSVVPSEPSSLFTYYRSCSPATGLLPSQTVFNIIAVTGLDVNSLTMANIKTVFTNMRVNTTYGPYINPLSIVYTQQDNISITTDTQFRTLVGSTFNILSPANAGINPNAPPIEETSEAYKCVPFDPDTQMLNGKIQIDASNGTVLSQVQKDRTALVANANVSNVNTLLTSDVYIKYVSTALAFLFTGIIGIIIVSFLVGASVGPSAIGHGAGHFHKAFKQATNFPLYLTVGILCTFIGFMIGMVIKYR
jgi:hypothetical protein